MAISITQKLNSAIQVLDVEDNLDKLAKWADNYPRKQNLLEQSGNITITEPTVESVAVINGISYQVVDSLPTSDINDSIIYVVSNEDARVSGKTVYDAYVYDGGWKKIGSGTDAGDYATQADLEALEEQHKADVESLETSISNLEEQHKNDVESLETSITTLDENKQDKLTAGTGIDITDNVISCTLDHDVFVYAGNSLPEHPDEADVHKIFLINNPNQTSSDNTLIEYIWVGSSYTTGSWEKIGEFNAGIDLDDYYTKSEVDAKINDVTTQLTTDLSDYYTKSEVDSQVSDLQSSIDSNTSSIATNTAAIETNASNISQNTSDISSLESQHKADIDYLTAAITSLTGVESADFSEVMGLVTGLQTSVDSNTSNIASNTAAISSLETSKQDTLTAGDNITISNNVISAVDTTYTAGNNVAISNANVISVDLSAYATEAEMTSLQSQVSTNASNITTNANNIASNTSSISSLQSELNSKQDTLVAGSNITISGNTISATDTTYTAGDNVAISNTNVISVNLDSYAKESEVTDLQSQVSTNTSNIASNTSSISSLESSKQDTLTAGDNVTISNNVISAVDTTYTAGTGIDISNDVISCTLDTELFIVTGGLPSEPDEADKNKIWVIPNDEAVPEDNQFIEYIWVDAWEKIGEFSASVDMTEYYTKTEVDNKLKDYATESDLSDLQEKLEKEITDAGGLTAINTTSTAPLTLTSSTSNGVATISGSVDAYSKSETDAAIAAAQLAIENEEADILTGYVTKSEAESTYQEKLTAGTGITIENNVISATATGSITGVTATGTSPLTLTATNNDGEVSITGSVDLSNYVTSSSLSTTLESYVTSSSLSSTLESYATSTDLSNLKTELEDEISQAMGGGITTINASGDDHLTLTASTSGTTTTITGSVDLSDYPTNSDLSSTLGDYVTSSDLSSTLENYATTSDLDKKQDTLTAGTGITISGNTISAAKYTGISPVSVSDDYAISVDLSGYQEKLTAVSPLTITPETNEISINLSNYVTIDDLNAAIAGITPGTGETEVSKVIAVNADTTGILNFSGTPQIGEVTITASINEANLSAFIEDYGYATTEALDEKQDKLTAGSNITISGTTISATDTTYTAGTNITISSGNVISATDTTYTAGDNVSISSSNVISVDLSSYVTSSDLTSALGDYVTTSSLSTTLGDYVTSSDLTSTLGDYVKTSDLSSVTSDISDIQDDIDTIVKILSTIVDGDSLGLVK